jgi:tRNA1(Val) A37 N6-methylase TrmN6
MIIHRFFSMPSSQTFTIPGIDKLLKQEVIGEWADPFARDSKLAFHTNDLNPNTSAKYNLEALEFLKMFEDNSLDGVLFDPPYSPRQLKECYQNIGESLHDTKSSVWSNWKKEIARIVKPGGKVISFGWNTTGIGMCNGFQKQKIVIVNHGANHNDTLITIEIKSDEQLREGSRQTKLWEESE